MNLFQPDSNGTTHVTTKLQSILTSLALLAAAAPGARAVEGIITADSSLSPVKVTLKQGFATKLAVSKASSAVVQFSLESLPAGATEQQIRKAVLKVFIGKIIKPGTLRLSGTDLGTVLDETTLNGATDLSNGTTTSITTAAVIAADAKQWLAFDVTDYLRSRVTAGSQLATFGLSHDGNAANLLSLLLDSKETVTTGHAPVLDIALGEGSVTPITVASVSSDGTVRALSGVPITFSNPSAGRYDITSIPASSSPSADYTVVVTPYTGGGLDLTACVRSVQAAGSNFSLSVETRNNGTLANSIFFISVWKH